MSSRKKLSKQEADWLEKTKSSTERDEYFHNLSGSKIPPLSYEDGVQESLGFPGVYPFTRGVRELGYRSRLWTMRQFAGFGSPKDTNNRFKYLLEHGQTGLSTAFDMPSLMGYDPNHPLCEGEVGREGVSVACIEDMEELFDGIDLSQVSTSMTINCSALPVLAMYFVLGKKQGHDLNSLSGTIQNDILKEFIAQKEWISPPAPSVQLVCDSIEFCAAHAKRFHPVSISGYHIREAGSTAVQELAFTLYDGITYVEETLKRGIDVDTFAPRLSFFWDVHNDFFEEIAKFRAARRMWATIMKERFGAKNERSLMLRTHAQTAGVSLTAQQPINNVARVAIQALAGVLGGTQSLHTNAMDETLSLPTEEAVQVALRTQQIIAHETNVSHTVDPLGGSYFVEWCTDEIEKAAYDYIKQLDDMGGMVQAIQVGFPQKEIAHAAYEFQKELERGDRSIVGVNRFVDDEDQQKIPLHHVPLEVEKERREKFEEFLKKRDTKKIETHIAALDTVLRSQDNCMPVMIDAMEAGVTLGEACNVYRKVFGEYRDPGFF